MKKEKDGARINVSSKKVSRMDTDAYAIRYLDIYPCFMVVIYA